MSGTYGEWAATLPNLVRQQCEICEAETDWTRTDPREHLWCKGCGYSKEMLEPDNYPGGCDAHPDATHEQGYGLAGGGFGVYSVCNECGTVFDKHPDPECME